MAECTKIDAKHLLAIAMIIGLYNQLPEPGALIRRSTGVHLFDFQGRLHPG
jgi:hypothetical protein